MLTGFVARRRTAFVFVFCLRGGAGHLRAARQKLCLQFRMIQKMFHVKLFCPVAQKNLLVASHVWGNTMA
jgi:hypothetical protein